MYEEDVAPGELDQSNIWDEYMERPLVDGTLFDGVPLSPSNDEDGGTQLIPPEEHDTLLIGEVPVLFPGKPYRNQIEIMKNVINSLNSKGNSLIESPTGSGKTLALLCAVLAWKKHEYMKNPGAPRRKIFYCTKTHAQISTVLKELRKTTYAGSDSEPRLKVSILGSRAQMCVNDAVIEESGGESRKNIDDICDKLKRNFLKNSKPSATSDPLPTCPFYKNSSQDHFFMAEESYSQISDIEDLRVTAKEHKCCPFFGSRRQLPQMDLIVCPYNYIISSFIRRSLKIDLTNCVLIFDEGHNLEKALCTEGSMSLSSNLFGEIFLKCHNLCQEQTVSPTVQEASKRLFQKFYGVHEWMSCCPDVLAGSAVVGGLDAIGLGPIMIASVKSDLNAASTNVATADDGPTLDNVTSLRIQKVITVLEYLYSSTQADYVLKLERKTRSRDRGDVKINIVCINPALVFREISSKTSSIAITSGTLTPLESYGQELDLPFSQPLSLQQIIPENRYWVAKLAVGPIGPLPKLIYSERSNYKVTQNLGESLIRICQEVPNGVLVFFPSKDFIRQMVTGWQFAFSKSGPGTILETLKRLKHVVNECDMADPQNARILLQQYRDRSKDRTGALFLGVHRGKVSEGTDFRDHEARAVINVGIPYAPLDAPEVAARNREDTRFWDWYTTDALRAVNQGLGRCVRHCNDWGAIIMIDPRFLEPAYKDFIAPWIESASNSYDGGSLEFDSMIQELKGFVRSMQ